MVVGEGLFERVNFSEHVARWSSRDVAKISNKWDYVDGRRVLWVTLKGKS